MSHSFILFIKLSVSIFYCEKYLVSTEFHTSYHHRQYCSFLFSYHKTSVQCAINVYTTNCVTAQIKFKCTTSPKVLHIKGGLKTAQPLSFGVYAHSYMHSCRVSGMYRPYRCVQKSSTE